MSLPFPGARLASSRSVASASLRRSRGTLPCSALLFELLQRLLGAVWLRFAQLAVLAIGLCLLHAPSHAQMQSAWLQVDDLPGLQVQLAVLPDPRETLSWAQVQASAAFRPLAPEERPVFSSTGMWFRIDLTVPQHLLGHTAWLRVLPALIWRLEWHDHQGRIGLGGMSGPVFTRDGLALPGVLPLQLRRPHMRLYLRVLSAAPQLTHIALLSDSALQKTTFFSMQLTALFIGAAGLMLLLTLLNWLYTRSEFALAFAFYLIATALFVVCVDGSVHALVLHDHPVGMARLSFASFMWAIAATGFFSLYALGISTSMPELARIVKYLVVCILLASLLCWQITWIAPVSALMWPFHLALGLLFLIISLVHVWRRRSAQSWVVFLAYLSFNVFEKYPLVAMLGWVAMTAWTTDVAKIGLLCQMLLIQLQWVMRWREQQTMAQSVLAATLEAQAERKQKNELLQFLGMFAHEVRTPLSVIHAATESLEMLPGAEQPAHRVRHQRIHSAVERLNVLSREALSRERIEASVWKPRTRRVDLLQLIESLLWSNQVELSDQFKGLKSGRLVLPWSVAGKGGGSLALELLEPLPALHADPDMLYTAIGNLLDNARKYALPGSQVHLRVASASADDAVTSGCTIDVVSQGIVLTEAERLQVFQKYWRRDETRNIPGAGIGLHMVRLIVQAHGGQITVHSLADGWTRFRIVLPCLASPSEGNL